MTRLAILIAAALVAAAPSALMAAPTGIAAAVAAPSRSADNVKLDDSRKPTALLQFLGLEQGDRVLDLFGGNRYWSEIMAPVVGPAGSVVVWEPTQFLDDKSKSEFAEFVARQPNVTLLASPFESPMLGHNAYDFAIMNLDYHDVYWESPKYKIARMDPDRWLKALYDAMKPGATVGIIDHVANAGGDTRATVEKLHRIDPAVIKADFERAGFVLEEQSDLLRNPGDDHSLLVFDPKIRGKTDRAVFRFRKPA
jgi:predicted methyltransferase